MMIASYPAYKYAREVELCTVVVGYIHNKMCIPFSMEVGYMLLLHAIIPCLRLHDCTLFPWFLAIHSYILQQFSENVLTPCFIYACTTVANRKDHAHTDAYHSKTSFHITLYTYIHVHVHVYRSILFCAFPGTFRLAGFR